MANKTQERLLEEFGGLFDGKTTGLDSLMSDDGVAAAPPANANGPEQSGKPASGSAGVTQSLTETISELSQMAAGMTANSPGSVAATPAGTDTRGGSSATTNSDGSGTSVGSIATTFLEGGLGIVPLITGLVSLFTGGSDAPPALEKYTMPSAISFESADTGSGLSAADFDQTGAPRLYSAAADSASTAGGGDAAPEGGAPGASGGGTASPQITVNVQAMDAQSFMDYSSQIAQAVRGAMLNLSSLNDVVNEL
jgi:hypothetical protein